MEAERDSREVRLFVLVLAIEGGEDEGQRVVPFCPLFRCQGNFEILADLGRPALGV